MQYARLPTSILPPLWIQVQMQSWHPRLQRHFRWG